MNGNRNCMLLIVIVVVLVSSLILLIIAADVAMDKAIRICQDAGYDDGTYLNLFDQTYFKCSKYGYIYLQHLNE